MARRTSTVSTADEANIEEALPTVSENVGPRVPPCEANAQLSTSPFRCLSNTVLESRPFSKTTIGASSVNSSLFTSMNPFVKFKVEDLTNFTMNDQRWTLQRKKIGLRRKTSGAKQRKVRNEQTKELALNFIRSTFTRKECLRYGIDRKRSENQGYEICRCGLTRYNHIVYQRAFKPIKPQSSLFTDVKAINKFRNYNKFPHHNEFHLMRSNLLSPLKRPSIVAEEAEKNGEMDEEDEEEEEKTDEGSLKNSKTCSEDADFVPKILKADGITQRCRERITNKEITTQEKQNGILNPNGTTIPFPLLPDVKGSWSPETCLAEFPTNAYGTIEFVNETSGSNKPAKYLRLSNTTDMSKVIKLFTDYWHLMEPSRPHLVISVIGGAKNFRLDGKKKESFNSGLLRAVKSTQAWILTGGMHVGATKSVGEAVNQGQFIVKVKRKSFFAEEQEAMVRGIKCVGVSPWGYIKNNHLFLNEDPNEFSQVRYKVEENIEKKKNVSLNGDHTHFLLIDDGIRNRYSGADKFRTKLQKVIQEPEPVGLGIPVVLLLLDGGISSIVECSMALKSNIPIVIVANTGRAADLFAYALSMTVQTPSGKYVLRKGHKKQLYNRVAATMTELEKSQFAFCTETIIECCSNAQLITIYDINCCEGMDKYILYAILKGGSQESESSKKYQLNLALLWNRPDIAETHIFPSCPVWPSESLEDLMTSALIDEKVEFVKLLVVNGLIVTEYLTVHRLRTLYSESYSFDTHLGKLLAQCSKSSAVYLCDVHLLLEALARKHNDSVYLIDSSKQYHEDPSINYKTFKDPYRELLLWAILSNRGRLALYLWERCNSPLVAAIVSTCVYRSLWRSLGAKNTEIRDEYMERKDLFENLALQYLNVCYKQDASNAVGMVERRQGKWGDLDCLEIAHNANDLRFLSSPCCQASVDISWRRGMIKAPTPAVLITIIFPFLLFTPLFKFQKLGDNRGNLTWFQKLIVFYKSPISKFYSHSITFVLFLLLYAYVVLFDFRPEMSLSEKFVLIWILAFSLEEVNELFMGDSSSYIGKFRDYWDSVWNRFDAISFILAMFAYGLRLSPSTFKWGRIAYALNTNVFYIRLFRIYHVNYQLGPKLVIFYRMISEVLVFMALLLIFILGYGIASQSLLHPWRTVHDTNMSSIMKQVILTPYWQMYGELQLEKIEGNDEERCPYAEGWGVEVCENPKDYTLISNMMLVFYLIIGNIMLLNLLIAIFTYVFDEVQENSMEIWKFEMYRLIREYDKKPGFVPPFVVFELLYRLTKCIWKKYCRKKKENLEDYMQETLRSLVIFEKEAMTSYLTKMKDKEEASLESTIAKMAEKIDKISKYIEQEEELKEIEEDIEWMIINENEERKTSSVINVDVRKRESDPSRKCRFGTQQQQVENVSSQSSEEDAGSERVISDDEGETENTAEDTVNEIEKRELKDEISEELSEDDMEEKLVHLQNKTKVYKEGFTSLPFPCLSRPNSGRPLSGRSFVSRPRTARSLLTLRNAQTTLKMQQDQFANISVRVDTLQKTLEESQNSMQDMMMNLLKKLETLQKHTPGLDEGEKADKNVNFDGERRRRGQKKEKKQVFKKIKPYYKWKKKEEEETECEDLLATDVSESE